MPETALITPPALALVVRIEEWDGNSWLKLRKEAEKP